MDAYNALCAEAASQTMQALGQVGAWRRLRQRQPFTTILDRVQMRRFTDGFDEWYMPQCSAVSAFNIPEEPMATKPAIVFRKPTVATSAKWSYQRSACEFCRFANGLRSLGVKER